MAKTKQEIEEWLKVFYQRQIKRLEEDDIEYEECNGQVFNPYEGDFIVYIPYAILELLPDWEDEWGVADWIHDESTGIGLFGIEEDDDPDEEAKEEFGVGIDELNDCYYKRFYCMKQSEIDWWHELGSQIKGKTGLPFEEVIMEEGQTDDEDDPERELMMLRRRLENKNNTLEKLKEELEEMKKDDDFNDEALEGAELLIDMKKDEIKDLETYIKEFKV